jgi:hypothetical protein
MEFRGKSGGKARRMEAQKSKCKGANRPKACAKVERLIQVGIALRAILGESRQLGSHLVRTLPEAE